MSTASSIVCLVFFVLVTIYIFSQRSRGREERICALFKLNASEYKLLGSDLGGGRDKVFLRADGAVGVSDAVFRHRANGDILVGEAKRRPFSGRVSVYEKNQVVLYIGLAERRFRSPVTAILRYGCGTCISLQRDPNLYRRLIGLIPQYRKVAKRLGL